MSEAKKTVTLYAYDQWSNTIQSVEAKETAKSYKPVESKLAFRCAAIIPKNAADLTPEAARDRHISVSKCEVRRAQSALDRAKDELAKANAIPIPKAAK